MKYLFILLFPCVAFADVYYIDVLPYPFVCNFYYFKELGKGKVGTVNLCTDYAIKEYLKNKENLNTVEIERLDWEFYLL